VLPRAGASAIVAISMLSGQMSPLAANALGAAVWNDAKSAVSTVIREARSRVATWPWEAGRGRESAKQQYASVADRAAAVDHFRLCPRNVELYVGEDFDLVPLPLDIHESPVNGVVPAWTISDQSVATVTNVGEVTAVAPGNAIVTATVGRATAHVMVTVLSGHRLRQTDSAWDNRHARDCDGPESAFLNNAGAPGNQASSSGESLAAIKGRGLGNSSALAGRNLRHLARPAGYMVHARRAPGAAASSGLTGGFGGSAAAAPFQILDGGSSDATSSAAAATGPNNAIGSPRFAAKETTQGAAGKMSNLLGSSNYMFSAPVLSLPGRGIATNLAMVYNGQLWSMQPSPSGNMMFFDLNKSWPAPGWSLGYGRLIPNYNGTAKGDSSGSTSANYPGDYLLIQSDGTRVTSRGNLDIAYGILVHLKRRKLHPVQLRDQQNLVPGRHLGPLQLDQQPVASRCRTDQERRPDIDRLPD
jgi:hypothetical protein